MSYKQNNWHVLLDQSQNREETWVPAGRCAWPFDSGSLCILLSGLREPGLLLSSEWLLEMACSRGHIIIL